MSINTYRESLDSRWGNAGSVKKVAGLNQNNVVKHGAFMSQRFEVDLDKCNEFLEQFRGRSANVRNKSLDHGYSLDSIDPKNRITTKMIRIIQNW